MTIQLNADQEQAASDFLGFLVTDEPEFVLSGGAGRGKTTLVKHLCGELKDYNAVLEVIGRKGLTDILMTATTHKAAEVLADATGQKTSTIHSALGLVIENDFATGRTKVKKGSRHSVLENNLIIIDECSMVDSALRKAIRESTMHCKIMYIGDKRQMAPIYEPISPIFDGSLPIHHLNIPMRNNTVPELMALCDQLELTVDTGVFAPIKEVPGVIEYLDDTAMAAMMHTHFSTDQPNCRILCYTNNRVLQYNNHMRFIRNLGAQFGVGEILVAGNAVRSDYGSINPEQRVTILDSLSPVVNPDLHGQYGYEVETYQIQTNRGTFFQPTNPGHLQMCIKHAAKEKNWPAYFFMKEKLADFRMPHASTVYKAQGSSYPAVFIDLKDIGSCNQPDQVARMLYVAISRAQFRVYLYGQLPEKYR